MIGGIIITHADFSTGLKNAVEMIAGKQEKLVALSLHEGEGLMDLVQKIQEEKARMEVKEVFLFVDLFGATPNNAASVICSMCDDPVIAGVNLPILLTFILTREQEGKEELLKQIENTSAEYFKIIRQKDIV